MTEGYNPRGDQDLEGQMQRAWHNRHDPFDGDTSFADKLIGMGKPNGVRNSGNTNKDTKPNPAPMRETKQVMHVGETTVFAQETPGGVPISKTVPLDGGISIHVPAGKVVYGTHGTWSGFK